MSVINLLPLSSKSTLSVCPAIMEVDTINISPCCLARSETSSAEGAGGARRRKSCLLCSPGSSHGGSFGGWGSRRQFWWPAPRGPNSFPRTAPWGGFTTAWPQVGAHNGFPLHTLHQGRLPARRTCLGWLDWDQDSAVPRNQCPALQHSSWWIPRDPTGLTP